MTAQGPIQEKMESRLRESFPARYFELHNESHMHSGPATESHFNLTVVSDEFENLSLVRRHQLLYRLFSEELASGVHALALHTYTTAEWEKKNAQSPRSPSCLGGGG